MISGYGLGYGRYYAAQTKFAGDGTTETRRNVEKARELEAAVKAFKDELREMPGDLSLQSGYSARVFMLMKRFVEDRPEYQRLIRLFSVRQAESTIEDLAFITQSHMNPVFTPGALARVTDPEGKGRSVKKVITGAIKSDLTAIKEGRDPFED